MDISIAEFKPVEADLGPACDIWNAAVAPQSELYLPMSPALMAERLAGRTGIPADICLLAEEAGRPVGLAIATTTSLTDRPAADLACMAVMPGARQQGIGETLLREVEQRCRAAGRETLKVDYSTTTRLAHGVDPTTPGHRWLLHRGFTVFRDQLFMRLEMQDWRLPESIVSLVDGLEASGVTLRPAGPEETPSLLQCAAEFGPWIENSLQSNAESATPAPVLVAIEDGTVRGFVGPLTISGCGVPDFDLIAVTASERGRGVGKALFYLCLEDFRQRGATLFELMTAPTNPAQKLYLDAGMRLICVLVCHEKRL
jgi:GNAT superfamily N-acetyltransferase